VPATQLPSDSQEFHFFTQKAFRLGYKSAIEVLTLPGREGRTLVQTLPSATVEPDAGRPVDIVDPIHRMLYEKEQRLKEGRQQDPGAA